MYILQPQDIIDGKWFYVKRGKRQVLFIKLKWLVSSDFCFSLQNNNQMNVEFAR